MHHCIALYTLGYLIQNGRKFKLSMLFTEQSCQTFQARYNPIHRSLATLLHDETRMLETIPLK